MTRPKSSPESVAHGASSRSQLIDNNNRQIVHQPNDEQNKPKQNGSEPTQSSNGKREDQGNDNSEDMRGEVGILLEDFQPR